MSEHRYILQPYKGMNTRHHCPSCQSREKTLSLYIDKETGQIIGDHVGRCNREVQCGYNFTPKQFFMDNITGSFEGVRVRDVRGKSSVCASNTPNSKEVSFVPTNTFRSSLDGYEENCFAQFLINTFGLAVAEGLIGNYFVGTSNHWPGATIFWQVDQAGKVRTGKIMLYSPETGKRVKAPFNHITWVHRSISEDYNLQQCFFGEHLLKDKTKQVAIVESEKTAIIASAYLPEFIWLATGSLTNLNEAKCGVLRGRNVTLFPDLNAFDKWRDKAEKMSSIVQMKVSDMLERKATDEERMQGLDLADFLLRYSLPDTNEDFIPEKAESPIHRNSKGVWCVGEQPVTYRYDPNGFYTASEREQLIMWMSKLRRIEDVPFNMLPEIVQQKNQFLKPELN